ncbi:MAG: response regulator [Nitriliruptorales bacterium]|nr:response regulator [Nitriliruptorales bacterium]
MDERPVRPVRILMVEDDEADVLLAVESLKQSKIRNDIEVVGTGEEAMRYLRGEGEHAGRPQPDLILLDINLPGMSGLEVLERIKDEDAARTIPVVMLTTSGEDADILRSYREHAAAYVQKPIGIEGFAKLVAALEDFWFQVVRLPPTGD